VKAGIWERASQSSLPISSPCCRWFGALAPALRLSEDEWHREVEERHHRKQLPRDAEAAAMCLFLLKK
jgi:hypothetical protein